MFVYLIAWKYSIELCCHTDTLQSVKNQTIVRMWIGLYQQKVDNLLELEMH